MRFSISNIDFYDFEALEKLKTERDHQHLRLILLVEEGDTQAKIDLERHLKEDRILKSKAEKNGFPWF